jgi:serine protease Do
MAKSIYEDLIETGKVSRGVLGVIIRELDPLLAESLGLDEGTKGIAIQEVFKKSPAEDAGLKTYDVIIEFNGKKVDNANVFRNTVAMIDPGTEVKLLILRDGKKKTFYVELGEKDAVEKAARGTSEILEKLGLAVENLTEEQASRFGYDDEYGVIVSSVEPGSPAEKAGLTQGLLIIEVNRQAVKNVKEFTARMNRAKNAKSVLLLIYNGNYTVMLPLEIPKD